MKYLLLGLLFAVKFSMGQNLLPADLELLHEQFNQANYLKSKGFVMTADSINGSYHATDYTNMANGSLLQVVYFTDSEGATTFEVHCYFGSETPYTAFINRLKESGFNGPKGDTFTKPVGTYASETVQAKGKQLYKGRAVYELLYIYAAGRELSQPGR